MTNAKAALLTLALLACTPQARVALAELLAEKIACAVAHADLPNDALLVECAVAPGDAEKVLKVVGESRVASAKAANLAASRAGNALCPDGGRK